MKHKLGLVVLSSALLSSLAIGMPAFAQATQTNQAHGFGWGRFGVGMGTQHITQGPGLLGTVTAITGSTLMVQSSPFGSHHTATTTYAVDASRARVTKDGRFAPLSAVVVGDKIMILGSVSSTSMTASFIRDIADSDHDADNGGSSSGNTASTTVLGTVSNLNGSSFTLSMRRGPFGYGTLNVNAGSSTVYKNGATSTLSSIASGDTVVVHGSVAGNTLTASFVRDITRTQPTQPTHHWPQGNGEPVVGGTVTAVGTTTLTITNQDHASYSIDASHAEVTKAGMASSTLSNVAVGDSVIVQGTVNGSSVAASSILDQGKANTGSHYRGVLGVIGGFLHRLFGF